jgi:Domain of Unknown Function with PDB structure (DUF3857)/Transglutaminase-like superfamily
MMACSRATSRLLLGISLLISLVSICPAADWPPITPEEQALKDVAQQPGASAVILERQEIADDLNNYHSTYKRIKVLTEAGRKNADVELPYNRNGFSISEISGRTVHPDGTVIPFEGKPFDKVLVRGRGIRIHVKAFTLPDVQVGSILDFRYSLRYDDRRVLAPEWIVQDDLFEMKANFKFIPFQGRGNVEITLPHGEIANNISWTTLLPAQFKPQQHTLPVSSNLTSNATAAYWVDLAVNDVPAFVEEPFMAPPEMLKWRVNFYYVVTGKPEDYWKDQGKFWNKDVESFLGKKHGIAETVNQVVGATDTPEQKTRKIYTFVSQLENQSYVPHRSELEEKALGMKFNAGVEDVLQQRSGDHDDLNRLLVAMLHAAGIPASLMLVPDRDVRVFIPSFLSMSQFSAEIAVAQVDGKEVFLDPGTKFCPYGITNWRYSGNQGLRQVEGKGAEIKEVPLSNYTQALVTRFARIKVDDEGRAEGTLGVAYYGLEAMDRRQQGARTDDEGRKQLLEDELKSWLPGDSEVSLTGSPTWDKTEEPLVATFKIKCPIMINAGKRALLPLHPFQFNGRPRFAAAQRTNSIYFYYPSREVDEVHVTLPSGVEVENLPANDAQKLSYAAYATEHKPEGTNGIFARRDLVMAGMAFPPTSYPEVKTFYDKVKAGDDQEAILKAVPHSASN